MSDGLDNAKRALRADLRERRQQRTAPAADAETEALTAHLDALVERVGARSLSCYLPTSTEPETRPFMRAAIARGIRVLLPITRSDGLLDWTLADPQGEIAEGLFGTPEQAGELLSPLAVGEVDLMLIPAAAVDRNGMRLGWGRGYFDKTLGSMQNPPPVYAVIFDSEIVDDVPRDVHDQPVDGVVTPSRILTFPSVRR